MKCFCDTACIREDRKPADLDWISALKTEDIRKLPRPADPDEPPLATEALIPDAVAEAIGPVYRGERLMVCLDLRLREEQVRMREYLLQAT